MITKTHLPPPLPPRCDKDAIARINGKLPGDVLILIFGILDCLALQSVKQVCKSWHTVALDSTKRKLIIERYGLFAFQQLQMCPKEKWPLATDKGLTVSQMLQQAPLIKLFNSHLWAYPSKHMRVNPKISCNDWWQKSSLSATCRDILLSNFIGNSDTVQSQLNFSKEIIHCSFEGDYFFILCAEGKITQWNVCEKKEVCVLYDFKDQGKRPFMCVDNHIVIMNERFGFVPCALEIIPFKQNSRDIIRITFDYHHVMVLGIDENQVYLQASKKNSSEKDLLIYNKESGAIRCITSGRYGYFFVFEEKIIIFDKEITILDTNSKSTPEISLKLEEKERSSIPSLLLHKGYLIAIMTDTSFNSLFNRQIKIWDITSKLCLYRSRSFVHLSELKYELESIFEILPPLFTPPIVKKKELIPKKNNEECIIS